MASTSLTRTNALGWKAVAAGLALLIALMGVPFDALAQAVQDGRAVSEDAASSASASLPDSNVQLGEGADPETGGMPGEGADDTGSAPPRDLTDDAGALAVKLAGLAYEDAEGNRRFVEAGADDTVDASDMGVDLLAGAELRFKVTVQPGAVHAGDTFALTVPQTWCALPAAEQLARANGQMGSQASLALADGGLVITLAAEAATAPEPFDLVIAYPLALADGVLQEEPVTVELPLPDGAVAKLTLPAKPKAEDAADEGNGASTLPAPLSFGAQRATANVTLQKDWYDNNDVNRPWEAIAADGTLAVWFTVEGGAKTKLDATTMDQLGLADLPDIEAISSGTIRSTYTCEGLPTAVTSGGTTKAVTYAIEEDATAVLATHGYIAKTKADGTLLNIKTTSFAANVEVRDGTAGVSVPQDIFQLFRKTNGLLAPVAEGTVAWNQTQGTYTVENLPMYDDDGNEYTYALTSKDTPVNQDGDYLKAEYDNTAVANHGTNVTECYDGGTINLTLTGEAAYHATKAWLDPDGTSGAARPDATFYLWRYTQKDGHGFAQASQVRNDAKELIVVKLEGAEKDADTHAIDVLDLPKYDPEGYPYVYLMREELAGSDPSYEQVFGAASEQSDGSVTFEDTLPAGMATRTGSDASLYNGGTISNRISASQSVTKKKTWQAPAYQGEFSDVTVTLSLQSRAKGAGENAWRPTGTTKTLEGFKSEILTKEVSASVSTYDALGRELEYRWVETSVTQGGGNLLQPDGTFRLACNANIDDPDNERYDKDWFVSSEEPTGKPDGGTWVVNRLQGEVDYAIDKLWRQLDGDGKPVSNPDGSPKYGPTPPEPGASIDVAIYKNGEKMDDRVYTMDGAVDAHETSPYHIYVNDLPKFDEQGRPITYTAHEDTRYKGWYSDSTQDTENRLTTIKNDPVGPGARIKVAKRWIDDSDLEHRYPVTVELHPKNPASGTAEPVLGPIVLDESNDWWTWVSVPSGKTANDYDIVETKVTQPDGSEYVPDGDTLTVTTDQHIYLVTSGMVDGTLTVTNKRIGTIDLTVTKTWVDKGADISNRPDAKLKLTCIEYPNAIVEEGGVGKVVLPNSGELPIQNEKGNSVSSLQEVGKNAASGASEVYRFFNLPKYDADGRVVHYAVKEVGSDGSSPFGGADYQAFVNQTGYVVGAVHTDDKQAISVDNRRVGSKSVEFHKQWLDDYAYSNGKRPDIFLTFWQKTASASSAAKAGDNGFISYHWKTRVDGNPEKDWTATITGLSKYDGSGEEIFYYAQESTNGDPSVFDYQPVRFAAGNEVIDNVDGAGAKAVKENGTFINAIESKVVIEGKKLWENIPSGFPYAQMPKIALTVNQHQSGSMTYEGIAETDELQPVPGTNEFTFSIPTDKAGNDLPKYDDQGRLYAYSVHEVFTSPQPNGTSWGDLYDQEGTVFTLENVFNTSTGNVGKLEVKKTWARGGDTRPYPAATFKLHRMYEVVDPAKTVDEVVAETTLTSESDTGSSVTFDSLLVYAPDGQKYRYYVEEEAIHGFASVITGAKDADSAVELSAGTAASATVAATNAYDQKGSISLAGAKSWDDYGNVFGLRPGFETTADANRVKLELSRTAPAQPGQKNAITTPEAVAAAPTWTKTDANTWSYAYTGLDRYAPNGMPWVYQVVERPIGGLADVYGAADKTVQQATVDPATGNVAMTSLTNSFSAQAKVEKAWQDNNDQYKLRPAKVQVKLQVSTDGGSTWSDAEDVLKGVMPDYTFGLDLSKDNDWKHTFGNLPPKESASGKAYSYQVVEVGSHPSYDVTRERNGDTTTITNALKAGLDLSVTKAWANDSGNVYGTRPLKQNSNDTWQILVTLQRALETEAGDESKWSNVMRTDGGGVLTETIEGSFAESTKTVTFSNLPKFDDSGKKYVYRAREAVDAAPAYRAPGHVDGAGYNQTTITNTLDTMDVSGTKTWADTVDTRPDPNDVALVLYRQAGTGSKEPVPGSLTPAWTDTVSNVWTYTYASLPTKDRTGASYAYTVEESPVTAGYWAAYDGTKRNITNTQTAFALDKVDEATPPQAVNDVELSVYGAGAVVAGQELAVWTRNAAGEVSVRVTGSSMAVGDGNKILGLPQGDYVLRETRAPAAYATADDIPFTVKADGTIESTTAGAVTGNPTSGIVITMKDRLAKAKVVLTKSVTGGAGTVKGVEFALYKQKGAAPDAGDDVVAEGLATDDAGTIAVNDLGVGAYYFKETKATPDTVLDPTPRTFTVTNADDFVKTGAPIAVSAENAAFAASLSLAKLDGTSGEALAGAAFALAYTPEGGGAQQTIAVPAAGSPGAYRLDNLQKGTYTITETAVPNGYQGAFAGTFALTDNDNGKTVVVKDGAASPEVAVAKTAGTWTADGVTNTRIPGSMTLTKQGAAGDALAGAEFALERLEGGVWQQVEVYTTAADGVVAASNLAWGTYRITETKAADGYQPGDPAFSYEFTIGPDNGLDQKLAWDHGAVPNGKTSVAIEKVDNANPANRIAGAKLKLEGRFADGAREKTWESLDSAAEAFTGALIVGETYTLTETERLGDYLALPGAITFKLAAAGTIELVGNPAYADGSKAFVLSPDTHVLSVRNVKGLGVATLLKTDADTGDPLNGVTFSLYDGAGTLVREGLVTGTGYDSTDWSSAPAADGRLTVKGLDLGDYYFQETAAEGYQVPGTHLEFAVDAANTLRDPSVDLGTVANAPTELSFSKVKLCAEACSDPSLGSDAPDAARPLAGAEFTVYTDEACSSPALTVDGDAAVAVSGTDGHVTFKKLAGNATYWLHETKVPDGCVDGAAVYKAVFAADGSLQSFARAGTPASVETQVANDVPRADIRIKKVAETDESKVLPNSVYGLYRTVGSQPPATRARGLSTFSVPVLAAASAPLAGNLQLVAKATTGPDGFLTFKGVLTDTEYVIRELVAPNGSLVSQNPISIEFTVDKAGAAKVVAFDDGSGTAELDAHGNIVWKEPQVKLSFGKKDPEGNLLAGAKLQVVDANGAVVVEPWTSSDAEEHVVEGTLTAGEGYRLVELEAPAGYQKAADVAFTVSAPAVGPNRNYVQRVEMVDERAPAPAGPAHPTGGSFGSLSRTGDSPMALVFSGVALASAGVAAALVVRRRRAE